ncbi:MAG TPA: hypothetical protein VNO51_20005 [Ilumatobacteraceae bacterium]|nr:hypothetical protein [Ilumatobacteraceae bacterium]
MVDRDSRSAWQHRYDESIARERAVNDADEASVGEVAAIEATGWASGWVPGWVGRVAPALSGAVLFIRRRMRRTSLP